MTTESSATLSKATLLPVPTALCNTENLVSVWDDERFPQGRRPPMQ
jgi:hypothetical protein